MTAQMALTMYELMSTVGKNGQISPNSLCGWVINAFAAEIVFPFDGVVVEQSSTEQRLKLLRVWQFDFTHSIDDVQGQQIVDVHTFANCLFYGTTQRLIYSQEFRVISSTRSKEEFELWIDETNKLLEFDRLG